MQVSFCLVGRHQQREQQVDRLIVDRVEGDGGFQLDKNADSTQRILFQFSVGNGDTIADPGTAHFSRVRIASNTTCGGKLNCLAASSLMISRARFLLWQCTATGTFWFRTLLSCRAESLFIIISPERPRARRR